MKGFLLIILSMMLFALEVNAQVHDKRLAKGKKVFVFPIDRKTTDVINGSLRSWGYWQVVENIEKADFVMKFNFERRPFGDRSCYIEFLDPGIQIPFETTYEYKPLVSFTSEKHTLARKVIRNLIKPDFF